MTPQMVRVDNLRPANLWMRVIDVMSLLLEGCRDKRRCFPHAATSYLRIGPKRMRPETSCWKCVVVFTHPCLLECELPDWLLYTNQSKVRTEGQQIECFCARAEFNTSAFRTTASHRNIHVRYIGEISPTRCNNCVFYSQWLYCTCFG